MRTALLMVVALALVLSAGAAFAYDDDSPIVQNGLIPEAAGWDPPGSAGSLPGGASDNFTYLWGGGWWDAIYDDDGGPNPWFNIGGTPGIENINVTCDIELYCYESLSANNVYFHLKGDNYDPRSAVIDGLIKSNNGEWVGIDLGDPNKNAFQLVGTTNGFGNSVVASPGYEPIPVVWELSEDGGATWRVADAVAWGTSNTVYAMWWLLANGEPCDHAFKFRITIDPKYHQPDGQYVMDPALVVDPVL